MKCERMVLLAACLAFSLADSDDEPLGFLFNRCQSSQGTNGVGHCVRELLRQALNETRPRFSTGLRVGNRTVVLEPLKLPSPGGSREGRSRKLEVTEAQLTGLSRLQLDSVMLTDSAAAAKVNFPELVGEVRGKIRYSFFPIPLKLKMKLVSPKLMVGARWSAIDGDLQLEEPHAALWLESYNISISGIGSTGRSVASALNENHKEIIEFLKPSLEAAVVRRINKMDQEERNTALHWLERALG